MNIIYAPNKWGRYETGFIHDEHSQRYFLSTLSTDGLSEGTWQIRATLDDGTVKTAFISLKAN